MILQWVYSYSCWNRKKRATDFPSRGFGSFSWSDGLSLAEVEELERRCSGYELPDWASSRPGEEEKRRLPLAFYSFRLASGKRVVVRTQYVGESFYDKRWGAIISHGMVLSQGDWSGYPAEWMDSPGFWKELPEAVRMAALPYKNDANRPDPDPLPVLSESEFRTSGNYSVDRVSRHFEDGEARGLLVRLLSLWSRLNRHPACAFFRCPDDEAPWLLAGFTMLFPPAWSQDLAFSTRLFSPMPMEEDQPRWYEAAAADARKTKTSLAECPVDADAESLVDAVLSDRHGFFGFLQGFHDVSISDWRSLLLLYRLVARPLLPGTPERLADGLVFLRDHGDNNVRALCLKGVLGNEEILPGTLSPPWIEALVSLCDGDASAEAIAMRLFLSQRRRFSPKEALDCFLSFSERNTGNVACIWLDDYATGDQSTPGVLFTLAAAGRKADPQEVRRTAMTALAGVETARDLDWPEILSFAATRFPSTLSAALVKCPREQAVYDFVSKTYSRPESVVPVVEQLVSADADGLAKRIVLAFLNDRKEDAVQAFVQLFGAMSAKNPPFAKAVFTDAFLSAVGRGASFSPTADEWQWFAEKLEAGFVPDPARDEYWTAVDAMAPPDVGQVHRIRPALDSFLRSKPVEAGYTQSDFLRWTDELPERKDAPFSFDALESFSPVFSKWRAADRKKWMDRLLPVLYTKISNETARGAIPASVGQHRQTIHFLSDGLDARERASAADSYVEHAVEDARKERERTTQRRLGWLPRLPGKEAGPDRPLTHSPRFGGLLRLVLRPASEGNQDLRAALLCSILHRAYSAYSQDQLDDEISMPALSDLSKDEKDGWKLLCRDHATMRKRRSPAMRIWTFFAGTKP